MHEHEHLVRHIHAELGKGNLAVLDEHYAPDYVSHVGGRTGNLEEYRRHLANRRTAFPDWEETIDDVIVAGDKVVTLLRHRGTHLGEWHHHHIGRLAPTGKVASATRIVVRRIANGKIAESWVVSDHLAMLAQLGAIPAADGR